MSFGSQTARTLASATLDCREEREAPVVREMPEPAARPWFNEIAAFLGEAYWAPGHDAGAGVHDGHRTRGRLPRRGARARARCCGCSTRDAGPGGTRSGARAARDRRRRCRPLARLHRARIGVGRRARRGRARAIRDRGSPRARRSTASSTPSSACARAASVCSAEARTKTRCSERFARALRPGGRLAVSAFNAYFALRHLETGDTFDAARRASITSGRRCATRAATSASSTSGPRASRRAS